MPWIILGIAWLAGTAYAAIDGRYEDAGVSLLLLTACGVVLHQEHRERLSRRHWSWRGLAAVEKRSTAAVSAKIMAGGSR